jgi:hypothetical protein
LSARETEVRRLQLTVLAHTAAEGRMEFHALAHGFDDTRLAMMRRKG